MEMINTNINPRIPLPDLKARFVKRRGLFKREAVDVRVFALTDEVCVVKTDESFKPGEELALDFSLSMPFEDLSAEGITAQVSDTEKYCSNFFYTLVFKEPLEQSRLPGAPQLRRIRDVLDRKLELARRRTGKPETPTS
ncbi:hypothetical protein QQM79_02725 [Marinobacteraceae bacterium S3BR75-40.1]